MKLQITCITNKEVGRIVGDATLVLRERFSPAIESRDYGANIEMLGIFFVSVDSDPIENERHGLSMNRAGKYKDLVSGKMVRFVGIAVPVDPADVLSRSGEDLLEFLTLSMFEGLRDPGFAMPKGLDHGRLVADIEAAKQ